jgi:hypothetical protein
MLRFSRAQVSITHPTVMEHIALPVKSIQEVRRVDKRVFIESARDTHTFEADTEADAVTGFEGLVKLLEQER